MSGSPIPSTEPADGAAIDYFSLGSPVVRFAARISLRARTAMYRTFCEVLPIGPDTTVVDIGVTPDRTRVDSNFFEELYPYKSRLTATSIEDASFLEDLHPGLRFVLTDGDRLPFDDGAFDIVFSSAVVEHVGDRDRQRRFLAEMMRVSKWFFVTTPNRNYPVEVHTFLPLIHWLPQPWHQAILRRIGREFWATTDNLNLLRPREFVALFPPGVAVELRKYRLLGLPSNLMAFGRSPSNSS